MSLEDCNEHSMYIVALCVLHEWHNIASHVTSENGKASSIVCGHAGKTGRHACASMQPQARKTEGDH